jgi:MFS family permease
MSSSRLAVKIVFFLNGFVHANLFSRLPRVQDMYHISNGTIGFVLLASSLGAVLAMPFTGWFIINFGSKRITIFGVLFYCVLIPITPLLVWPGLPGLVFLFFLMGVSAGMMDVAMNAQAVLVEKQLQKPIMTSFHALFSIGMMIGAACGSLFAEINTSLFTHFSIVTGVSVIICLIARYYLIHDKPEVRDAEGPAFRLPNAAMVSIGVIAFCCMMGEGAMADWSTNYMENIARADKGIAPLGLSAFALAMTIGRLLGDNARLRFGDRRLMLVCGTIATLGIFTVVLFIHPMAVIAGLFAVGLGLSVIVPISYSLAGHEKNLPPGVGLAMVTTVGYTGFLFGPPMIGLIAQWQNLRIALLVVGVMLLFMTFLSHLRKPEQVK